MELIDRNKFAKAVLNENVEAFVVYMASLTSKMTIHLIWKAQIALLLSKYFDFAKVFSKKLAKVLLK